MTQTQSEPHPVTVECAEGPEHQDKHESPPHMVGGYWPRFTWPRHDLHASGHYEAPTMIMTVDAKDAAALLPGRLKLGKQSLTEEGKHPLVILLGHHRDVKANWSPFKGGKYYEFICAVPFVHYRDADACFRGPYAYMRRLYLDSLWFTILGWFYGFPKLTASIRGSADHYQIKSLFLRRRITHAKFTDAGERYSCFECPNFEASQHIWQLPFIGKLGLTPYLSSIMNFKLEDGTAQPMEVDLTVHRAVPGLAKGQYDIPSIADHPHGGYRLSVPWTLSPPMSPKDLHRISFADPAKHPDRMLPT